MKKFIFAVASLLLGVSTANAGVVSTPKDSMGLSAPAAYAGASICGIDSSTGTAAVLCATGKGIVFAVITSSVATTDWLMLRDSATANSTSAKLVGITAGTTSFNPVSVRFTNGLSANVSVAPPVTSGYWAILYRLDGSN